MQVNEKDIGYNAEHNKVGKLEKYNDPLRLYIKYDYPYFTSLIPVFKKDLKFIFQIGDGTNIWYL